jgi:hypothetical protein
MGFTTYQNTANRHVTIHRDGCTQIKKHGGKHHYRQGGYRHHKTYADAITYAESTNIEPVKSCYYCKPVQ